MYNNARQTSQGTQRCYTVNHTPIDATQDLYSNTPILRTPRLQRQTVRTYFNNQVEEFYQEAETLDTLDINDLQDIEHEVSNFEDAPYLTPTTTQLMREISSTRNVYSSEDSNDDIEEETQNL
jgi:hypothetical protein